MTHDRRGEEVSGLSGKGQHGWVIRDGGPGPELGMCYLVTRWKRPHALMNVGSDLTLWKSLWRECFLGCRLNLIFKFISPLTTVALLWSVVLSYSVKELPLNATVAAAVRLNVGSRLRWPGGCGGAVSCVMPGVIIWPISLNWDFGRGFVGQFINMTGRGWGKVSFINSGYSRQYTDKVH